MQIVWDKEVILVKGGQISVITFASIILEMTEKLETG